jgi:hypothetical protein
MIETTGNRAESASALFDRSPFQHYRHEYDARVPRAEFVAHLRNYLDDRAGFFEPTEVTAH